MGVATIKSSGGVKVRDGLMKTRRVDRSVSSSAVVAGAQFPSRDPLSIATEGRDEKRRVHLQFRPSLVSSCCSGTTIDGLIITRCDAKGDLFVGIEWSK